MEKINKEVEEYIKESIDECLGLSVSKKSLQLKLKATEYDCEVLRDQNLYMQRVLVEKDNIISRARAEASMNAQAVKKFVEENQKLAVECANLLSNCTKWEKECSLYDHDREALMDFANEADERAKDAEIRVRELEDELKRTSKHQSEMHSDDSSAEGSAVELMLLENLMTALIDDDTVSSSAHGFLEANSEIEVCQRLLKKWDSLRPLTTKALALTSELRNVQNDKEQLRINLAQAEEEVSVLAEENKLLYKENKRLVRREKDMHRSGSSEKLTSTASTKGNKRKSTPKICSPIERKIDFINVDSPRKPLSPLQHNSPRPENIRSDKQEKSLSNLNKDVLVRAGNSFN